MRVESMATEKLRLNKTSTHLSSSFCNPPPDLLHPPCPELKVNHVHQSSITQLLSHLWLSPDLVSQLSHHKCKRLLRDASSMLPISDDISTTAPFKLLTASMKASGPCSHLSHICAGARGLAAEHVVRYSARSPVKVPPSWDPGEGCHIWFRG